MRTNRYLLLALIAFCSLAFAVDIPDEHRIKNVGGYCTWSSIGTVAKHLGIERLQNVAAERWYAKDGQPDPGYDEDIIAELDSRKIKYEIRKQWSNSDVSLLEQYADKYGVVVSLIQGNPWSIGCHTIVVTAFNRETVEFYDSSRPTDDNHQPVTWACSRQWFETWWLGSSLVILPD